MEENKNGENQENFYQSAQQNFGHFLLQNVTDPVVIVEGLKIISCNEAAINFYEVKSADVLTGRFPFENSPDLQNDGTPSLLKADIILRDFVTGEQLKFNWKFQKRNKATFDCEVLLSGFHGEISNLICLIIKNIDSNDIDKFESQRQIDYFKGMLEAIQQPVFIKDKDLRYIYCNQAFIKLIGKTREEIIGSDVFTVIPSERAENYHKADLDLLEYGGFRVFESHFEHSDKSEQNIIIQKQLLKDQRGEIIGIAGILEDISGLKKRVHELTLKENKYQRIFENVQDVFYQTDLNGIITEISPSIRRFSDFIDYNVIGESITQFYYYPEEREILLSKLKAEGEIFDYELLIKGKNGQALWASLNAHLWYDAKGNVAGTEGTIRDITKRKQIEQELRESEERYRTFFYGSPDAIFLADIETGMIIDANPAAARLLKMPVEDIIKLHQTLLHPKNKEEHSRNAFNTNSQKAQEKQKISETFVQCSDGTVIPVEILANRIHVNGISVLQGVFRNISDRKDAEERLRESEIKYRTLIETLPDGVYRSTAEGKFVEVNDAMVKILGYDSKEDLLSINIKTDLYFKPEDRMSLILEKSPADVDIYTLKKKDGSAVWVEDHGWYLRDRDGNITFHEGIMRDVTARKMAEMQLQKNAEELKELNATKDKFFSIIAHDIKTPFNSILGLSDIIRNDARHMDIGTIEQYVGVIYSTSKNTYRLLENLLEWSRLQQSHILFNRKQILLARLVGETVDLLEEKAKSKKITVSNKVAENLIVSADEDILKTIFRNLISNALKFTSTNGEVEIFAEQKKGETIISIQDNGIGISKENIKKIFGFGSNFSQRGTENEIGTGLGLMLCREFIEKHGGKIWVESEEGKGSKFSFVLK